MPLTAEQIEQLKAEVPLPSNGNGSVENDVPELVEKAEVDALRTEVAELRAKTEQPIVVQAPSTPARGRGRKVAYAQAPTARSAISRLFSSANGERFAVYKKVNEKDVYIGEYGETEFAGSSTMESFLAKVIYPAHKAKDYRCVLLDAVGTPKASTVHHIDPEPQVATEAKPLTLESLAAEVLAETAKSKQVTQTSALTEILSQLRGSGGNPDMRAILDRLDRLAQNDSPEKILISKLLGRLEQQQSAPAPLPPLAPISPTADASSVVRDILGSIAPMLKPDRDQLTIKDVLEVMEKAKPAEPKESFFDQMIKFSQAKAALFGNDSAEMVRMREQNDRMREELREMRHAMERAPDPLEQIKSVTEVHEALESLAKRRGGGSDSFGGVITDAIREGRLLIDAVRAREDAARRAGEVARPRSPEPSPTPQTKIPSYTPFVNAIKTAKDDVARIKATLAAFQWFAKDKRIRPYFTKAIDKARHGDKSALEELRAFAGNLASNGLLTQEEVDGVVQAFDTHWDDVIAKLFGRN